MSRLSLVIRQAVR